MEASTATNEVTVAVPTDSQGNGVQELDVNPDQVVNPHFEDPSNQGSISVQSSTNGKATIQLIGATADSAIGITYSVASTGASDGHQQELERLKNDGIISQAEYDAAVARLGTGAESPDEAVKQAQSDLGAAQGGQAVPEQRPQAFQSAELRSDSEQRARENDPGVMGLEERERAHSEQAMKEAADNSRMPNLPEGQRVVIQGDHSEAGRMAYVLGIHYTDGIQDMIARSPSPESRFAEVDHYVLRTRDGRSDLLTATPEQVKPIEENQGWGRGQI